MSLDIIKQKLESLMIDYNSNLNQLNFNDFTDFFHDFLVIKNDLRKAEQQESSNKKLAVMLAEQVTKFENVLKTNQLYINTERIYNQILNLFEKPFSTDQNLINILEKNQGKYHLELFAEVLVNGIIDLFSKYKKFFVNSGLKGLDNTKCLMEMSIFEVLTLLCNRFGLKMLGYKNYQQEIMKKAIVLGDLDLITLLIKSMGISVNLKIDQDHKPIINWAMQLQNIAIINLLVQLGADINMTNDEKFSMVHEAVLTGNFKFIEAVLKINGLNLTPVAKNGLTPMQLVVTCHDSRLKIKIVELFLKEMPLISFDDEPTANQQIKTSLKEMLFLEVKNHRNKDFINFLLSQSFNINEDDNGWTILTYAIKKFNGKIKAIKAKYFDKIKRKNLIAIEITAFLEILEILVKAGADINLKDKRNNLPILEAMNSKKIEIMKFLIKKGAKLDYIDENYNNLLHKAILLGNEDAALVLLKSGVSSKAINRDQKSCHALAIDAGMKILAAEMLLKGVTKRINN